MTRLSEKGSPTNLKSFLSDIEFPAGRKQIIEQARQQRVGPKLLEAVESLPEQEYQSVEEVMQCYGAAE